jgi:hypothetical protein
LNRLAAAAIESADSLSAATPLTIFTVARMSEKASAANTLLASCALAPYFVSTSL